MGFWHKDREPQPHQTVRKEPLADLNAGRSRPEGNNSGSTSRRRRLSGAAAEDSAAQPQSPTKPHRRSLGLSETETSEPPIESQPQSEPQRPRLAGVAGTSQAPESAPKPGRSRGAITHPCDYVPELQNIADPPRVATAESAQAPREETLEPPASAKPGRRCLGTVQIDSADEPPSEPRPEPGPRRARLVLDAPVASDELPSAPTMRRSRGAISHPCDDPPGLQNIIDPPRSVCDEPAPAPRERTPEPQPSMVPAQVQQFIAQYVAELRTKQNFSMALVGGLAVAIIGATAWALVAMTTSHATGWMAVGVGLLVGGAVRTLGRGIDRSFGYLGATMSLVGCLLGNLLSVCTIVAGQENLSLVAVLGSVCTKPAVIPAALIATFHPLDLLFYGIALYEGYRFSFRQVTDTEITRALCHK
jgi:hypothetical protein